MLYSFTALSLLAVASAHQNFHQVWVNDVSPGYQIGVRMPPSNSPVTDVTSNDMACNVDGSTVPSGVETMDAAEGDKITVGWDNTGHPGPITHFLFGPVDDASKESGIGAGWFKIDERNFVDGKWANEFMSDNGGNYTFSLPTGLASGEYLLRSEMLALHGSQTAGGGQFYMGCAQLKITGTGSAGSCTPSISIPGAYKADDSNIYIPDFYNGFDASSYTAPGGPVASCGGSGTVPVVPSAAPVPSATSELPVATSSVVIADGPGSAIPAIPSATPTPSSNATLPISALPTLVVPTTLATAISSGNATVPTFIAAPIPSSVAGTAPEPISTGGAGTVTLYGQCGGANFAGSKQCATGTTCQKQNDYYSQCVGTGAVKRGVRQYVRGL